MHELTVVSFAVGDVCTFAVVSTELPTMERTLETTALHQTSGRQVGAVVAAVGVQGVSSTVLASKHRQRLTYNPITRWHLIFHIIQGKFLPADAVCSMYSGFALLFTIYTNSLQK